CRGDRASAGRDHARGRTRLVRTLRLCCRSIVV
ncbi:MAG: hypothetical protein AVDCRST_MAG28-1278, partial [uncultured Rubrobacteraceae bacterium]